MMVILSPFFIIGCSYIAKWIRTYAVIPALIIPIIYFVCTSGLMYQFFDNPRSIVLNSTGTQYNYLYVHEEEAAAGAWIRQYGEKATIYTDVQGWARLQSLALAPHTSLNWVTLVYPDKALGEGYLFLRYLNVHERKLMDGSYGLQESDKYAYKFKGENLIYSSRGAQFWYLDKS